MQKPTLTSKLTGFFIACAFGLFLIFGTLSSSDFPRFTYQPPWTEGTSDDTARYAKMGECGFNIVVNAGGVHSGTNLPHYLNLLYSNGMKAILKKDGDNLIWKYTYGQYHQYQADWDYYTALDKPLKGWYHFWHSNTAYDDSIGHSEINTPLGGVSWKCTKASDDEGVMLKGPYETRKGTSTIGGYHAQSNYPDKNGNQDFISIFRVMADTNQLSDITDDVFTVKVRRFYDSDTIDIADFTYTGEAFRTVSSTDGFASPELGYTIADTLPDNDPSDHDPFWIFYEMYWHDNCDFWVDWVEFMDVDRAKYLFYKDAETDAFVHRDSTWGAIFAECNPIEQAHGDSMCGWRHSDEPIRATWESHKVIVDSARANLEHLPLSTFLEAGDTRRCSVYVDIVKPDTFMLDKYVFGATNEGQAELDELAKRLENGWAAARLNGSQRDYWVALQAHMKIEKYFDGDPGNDTLTNRNPTSAELKAETFIALAHGAQGIGFWKYTSSRDEQTTSTTYNEGLVDSLCDSLYYKWYTVQEINAQLDSIGDILLDLERQASFCATAPSYWGEGSITKVEFTEDDDNYIEVGQFTDSLDNEYLILVNRRTDADRHINVYTDLTGANVLKDIYTQEQFLSSTGNFEGIPFDSGEGRVFRIEEAFND